jgi:hypothetical protein
MPAEPTRSAEWFRSYRTTRPGPVPHGTQNAYANYACRCESCRAAHRRHMASSRSGASA